MVHRAYNGGSGATRGVETSESSESYRNQITDENQRRVLRILARRRDFGATAKELANEIGEEKAPISSALTNLHIGAYVDRLRVRREHHYVYVLPQHVLERETKPYRPQGIILHQETSIHRAELIARFLGDRGRPGDGEVARLLNYVALRSRKEMEALQNQSSGNRNR